MSRITQDIAKQVSVKLLEKKKEAKEKALQDFKQAVLEEAIKQTPKDVLAFFETNKKYCIQTSKIILDGHGFNHKVVNISSNVPCIDQYSLFLKLNKTVADKFQSYNSKCIKLEEDYEKAQRILENALLNCRTFKNVAQNLPEAVPFLPKAQTMALAVNYADVRKLIA